MDDLGASAKLSSAGARACDADTPGDIPHRGWWNILQRLGGSLSRDDVWLRAAGVAFCALLPSSLVQPSPCLCLA